MIKNKLFFDIFEISNVFTLTYLFHFARNYDQQNSYVAASLNDVCFYL